MTSIKIEIVIEVILYSKSSKSTLAPRSNLTAGPIEVAGRPATPSTDARGTRYARAI